MKNYDLYKIKDLILDAVFSAGEFVLSAHDIEGGIIQKEGDDNYVTAYDIETQRRLIERFSEILPEAEFLAEENGLDSLSPDGKYFVIDPIDGTTNFMHSLSHSAISVALFDGKEAVFGCVLNPYLGECFHAVKGGGAYLRKNGVDVPISVSDRGIGDSLVSFGTTPYDKSHAESTFSLVCDFFRLCRDVRRCGSAALDLCYIAAGRYDVFFELTLSPWDFAAASLIIGEAGGVFTDLDGKPITENVKSSVLAANKACYEKALSMIKAKRG